MQSKARTVDQYLAELPADRRLAISAVRRIVLKNLPEGFIETMQYGMISYVVPMERYPSTYNGQPLSVVGLASHKNYMSLYLFHIYGDWKEEDWFKKRYEKSGKKLDMGKSCVRFKKVEDLPLELIGEAVARTSVEYLIEQYEKAHTKQITH